MRAWEDFIKKQESHLGAETVNQWLRALTIVHFDSGNLYLEAKDSFQILWFEEHIRPLLKSQLLNNNFRPIKVHLTVSDTSAPPVGLKSKKEKAKCNREIQFVFDKLDPSMTLDNFVIGMDNQIMFHFFCELLGYHHKEKKYDIPIERQKLLETPPTIGVFNPIYLWGEPGCGKTHLLIALTQVLRKKGLNALYARAETFTEHVVSAIRASEMQAFRKAYRHVDVLLIDDVHVFARKSATQEEFFHTFNTLHTSGRQMILSSKCAPALLEEIEPRLVSRFEWGINIYFQKLKSEELKAMLLKRCASLNYHLSNEVIHCLVQLFQSSKSLNRALEALILRSHFEQSTHHKKNIKTVSKEAVEEMLADLILQEQKTALSPEKIITAVSTVYGIRSEDLLGKSQAQDCSLPRQIAMYLCRHKLKLPFQGIGKIFRRDHSTVITSFQHIEKKLATSDKELLSSLLEIENLIRN